MSDYKFGSHVFSRLPPDAKIMNVVNGQYPLSYVSRTSDIRNPNVWISAGVHGMEQAGPLTALQFLETEIQRYQDRFNFHIFPCVNPWGFDNYEQYNSNGFNLNRSFGIDCKEPEVFSIENWLERINRSYLVAFDLHEGDDLYEDENWKVEDNPNGCWIYESSRDKSVRVGDKMIAATPPGHKVCDQKFIYGDDATNGVVYYPEACHNEEYAQCTSLDAYLFDRYTHHSYTTETIINWPMADRVDTQLTWLRTSLDLISNRRA